MWAIIGAVDTDVRCLLLSICGWPHNELATTRGNSVRMPPLAKYRHSRMTQADAEVVGDSFIIPLTTCADNMAKSGGSFVWKFFELSDDKKQSKCTLCKATLTYFGGTSSMRNHLKHVHSSVFASATSTTKPGPSGATASQPQLQRQTSLMEYHDSRRKLTKPRQVNKHDWNNLYISCV